MNEQEMIQKQKIEKREKTDIMLAYILIVVLLGCIGFVVYLKFIKKEEVKPVIEEPVSSNISLDIISNGFNNSDLVSNYLSDNKTINSTVSNDALVITYEDGTDSKNYNIPLTNDELVFSITDDDTVIVDIYKEFAYIVCSFYGNDNSSCRTLADSIKGDMPGIRFEKSEDTNNVYVSITNSIASANVTASEVSSYTEETITELTNTNYTLNINNTTVKDITVTSSDNGIKIGGNVTTENPVKVIIKLYDNSNSAVKENTLDNISDTFEYEFTDITDISVVTGYSINIEK